MEPAVEEALRAKAFAEKQFMEKDFHGAKNYALKAQMLCPDLEGISQMVATFGVYVASEAKINGELDFYSILGLDPSTEKSKLKKRYKKMAVLLHPDKNRTVGADGAFRLVSEAWSHLSDNVKRSSYDQRRSSFTGYGTGAAAVYDNRCVFSTSNSRLDTFWTVCSSCHVQYEYLRKYVNKRLSCKNCRGVFVAVETGLTVMNGSLPYNTHSYMPENGYGSRGCAAKYMPTTAGHNSGHRPDCVSNISFQAGSTVNRVSGLDPGLSASSFVFNGEANKLEAYGKHDTVKTPSGGHKTSNGYPSKPKRGRPAKVRHTDLGSLPTDVRRETCPNAAAMEVKMTNGNATTKPTSRLSTMSDTTIRRVPAAPAFDARQLLIDKAKTEIRRKLEEMRLASEAAGATAAAEVEKRIACDKIVKSSEGAKAEDATGAGSQSDLKRSASMSITVPDSDFHDFDKDSSEECFKPKQIWALYDEEDSMPRLYCLIREVISVNPFKIHISYLSSRSDCEFGSVNWMDSGFTKSCGSFRVFHSEVVEHVNIFSHHLSRERVGRGGCIRIYPRCGDIWAVYRNWSPDWDRSTPDEVRHQYEMVEVLSDYSDENGLWVTPLVKLDGYKTVYQRNSNTSSIRWIPRREMLRFSHQVPSCSLEVEGRNLPEGCWDLDPAATPDMLLQGQTDLLDNATDEEGKHDSEQDANYTKMSVLASASAPNKRPKVVESAGKQNSHGTPTID